MAAARREGDYCQPSSAAVARKCRALPAQGMPGVVVRTGTRSWWRCRRRTTLPVVPRGAARRSAAAAAWGRHAESEGEGPAAEILLQPQPQAALPQRPPPRGPAHRLVSPRGGAGLCVGCGRGGRESPLPGGPAARPGGCSGPVVRGEGERGP